MIARRSLLGFGLLVSSLWPFKSFAKEAEQRM